MKLKCILLVVGGLAVSFSANAVDKEVSICSLQISDNGSGYLAPCGGWASQNSCNSGGWITWDAKTEAGKIFYSTALTALVSEKKVKLRFNGSQCAGSYDVTQMVRISK
ncbi:hypothetical protein [Alteromonas sp. ASW11-130]|uniref:hypothetical protein n=1 Tax=Alteromonas sp. ASW11-130 TaxID=3015775 RepID=UPI00224214C2|nr:hypothetical protein [Alteromonas sp. ASW11-130]MCW8090201.1 hypothetical protein [Alteromonas sp. ASW11-130]